MLLIIIIWNEINVRSVQEIEKYSISPCRGDGLLQRHNWYFTPITELMLRWYEAEDRNHNTELVIP